MFDIYMDSMSLHSLLGWTAKQIRVNEKFRYKSFATILCYYPNYAEHVVTNGDRSLAA